MSDFSKYFNIEVDPETESTDEKLVINNNISKDNGTQSRDDLSIIYETENPDNTLPIDEENIETKTLTLDEIKSFCDRMSGNNATGHSKAVISYQSYKTNELGQFSPEADQIYQLLTASAEFSYDVYHPDLMLITLKFNSYDDPGLRLFWRRLQLFRTDLSKDLRTEKYNIPVFLIHFLERDSIGDMNSEEVNPELLEVNVFNPMICYLTRETPTMMAIEETNLNDEKMGGNLVKMLCSVDAVQFITRNDIDILSLKSAALREANEDIHPTTGPRDDLID